VAVGFTAASGYSFLPNLVDLARTKLPNVDLTLRELVSGEQVEALLTGRIDLGLVRPPLTRPEFDKVRVLTEPLVAALPSGDPRLEKAVIALSDFDDQPMVMYAPEGAGYFHGMLTAMFDEAGVSPQYVQHMSQIHSILALVHARIGAAVVPEAATRLHFEGVEFRPLETSPERPVELFVAWRRDNDNPSLKPLLALIEAQADHPLGETSHADPQDRDRDRRNRRAGRRLAGGAYGRRDRRRWRRRSTGGCAAISIRGSRCSRASATAPTPRRGASSRRSRPSRGRGSGTR
jgi:DNA-binding transcriptional LysR family regulator